MICHYLITFLIGILVTFETGIIHASDAIVGGDKAKVDQFPYQVSVQRKGRNICGGGIMSNTFILTAAHCVVQPNNTFRDVSIHILAGTVDLLRSSKKSVTVDISKIFVPTEYKHPFTKSTGDIAVLKLKEPMGLWNHKHLKRLKLPTNKNESYVGRKAMIAGFGWNWIKLKGRTEDGSNKDGRLRYAEADVISNRQCQENFSKVTILEKHICAVVEQRNISEPRGVCTGDSGGPLVHNDTVIGILSGSPPGCNELKSASMYTRVTDYLDFIRTAMENKKADDIRSHVLLIS